MIEIESKCPFSMVLAAGSCQCSTADHVVRRGGSEFDCKESSALDQCRTLTQHLNAVALPALGYENDLTQTPKSVYERILLGGLQGLRTAMDANDSSLETADIAVTVSNLVNQYEQITSIPADAFLPAIEACRIKKRRRHG